MNDRWRVEPNERWAKQTISPVDAWVRKLQGRKHGGAERPNKERVETSFTDWCFEEEKRTCLITRSEIRFVGVVNYRMVRRGYLCLVFVMGRGGAGQVFTRQAPPLHGAGGNISSLIPVLPPFLATHFGRGPVRGLGRAGARMGGGAGNRGKMPSPAR